MSWLLPCVAPLTVSAEDVAGRFERVAKALRERDRDTLHRPPAAPPVAVWPNDLGRDLYHLADLRVWLDGLRDDLGRTAGTPENTGEGVGLRVRAAGIGSG